MKSRISLLTGWKWIANLLHFLPFVLTYKFAQIWLWKAFLGCVPKDAKDLREILMQECTIVEDLGMSPMHSGQLINGGGDKTVPIDKNEWKFGISLKILSEE